MRKTMEILGFDKVTINKASKGELMCSTPEKWKISEPFMLKK